MHIPWRHRRTLWSHQAALSKISSPALALPVACLNVARLTLPPEVAAYFPASCQHILTLFRCLVQLSTTHLTRAFQASTSFCRADWVNERNLQRHRRVRPFPHFEWQGSGLKRFFERVYVALRTRRQFVRSATTRVILYIKARKLHPVRAIHPPMKSGHSDLLPAR